MQCLYIFFKLQILTFRLFSSVNRACIMHRMKKLTQVVGRCFSSQSQVVAQDTQSVAYSRLDNGLRIATCNEHLPSTRLVFMVKTGSRDDAISEYGLTHCLQASAGLTSAKNTAFLTTQLLASLGADLEVTAGRDHIIYSIDCIETAANELINDVITPSILSAKFPWYDLRDHLPPKMRYQKALAENDPLFILMQSAHEASFREGYSNPIVSPDYMIGKHTADMLAERYVSTFSLNNMVLAGSGISHDALKEIGSNLDDLDSVGEPLERPAPAFVSSECHVDRKDDISYAALTFEGVSLEHKDAIVLSILQQVLGTDPNIKGGLAPGLLNAAVVKNSDSPFSLSTFSVNYSDCGLFGVTLVSPNTSISELLHLTSSEIHSIVKNGINKATIETAKQKLKSRLLIEAVVPDQVLQIAYQALTLDNVLPPQHVASLVDEVTTDDVVSVARQVLGGKKSLATIGQNRIFLQDL